jgi:hypothetical protein
VWGLSLLGPPSVTALTPPLPSYQGTCPAGARQDAYSTAHRHRQPAAPVCVQVWLWRVQGSRSRSLCGVSPQQLGHTRGGPGVRLAGMALAGWQGRAGLIAAAAAAAATLSTVSEHPRQVLSTA